MRSDDWPDGGWSSPASDAPRPRGTTVLFDMDGTLIDGAQQITDIMVQAFLAAGEAPPTRADVIATIGLSMPQMVDTLLPAGRCDALDKIVSGYRLRFADAIAREAEPPVFPGVEPLLRDLRQRGAMLALTTGRSRLGMRHCLDALEWHGYFDDVQCADDNPSKPDPSMIRKALAKVGRARRDAVLVGDTVYDMRMARAAGVDAIGVSWGYNPPDDLRAEGAVAIASDMGHLGALLAERVR